MRKIMTKGTAWLLIVFYAFTAFFAAGYTSCLKAHAAEDFRTWRQFDSRWENERIGGSTVRSSGCYITSIAMVAAASGARSTESFDPGVFARELNKINAFNQWGGLSSWSSVNKIVNEVSITSYNLEFASKDQKGKAAELKKLLDAGNYVICNVGGHWVYIDGVIGDDVYMADPAKDEILMFEAYKNENITVYQTLKGKVPYSGFTPLYGDVTEDEELLNAQSMTASSLMTSVKAVPDVYDTGEYCCNETEAAVYTEPSIESLSDILIENGNVVRVISVSGSFGEVEIDGAKLWINLSCFTSAEVSDRPSGDINNDGYADEYDLAILNEYLSSLTRLPEGVSLLTDSEKAAADINGDKSVDNIDVLMFLMRICS